MQNRIGAVLNVYSCVFPGLGRGEVSYRESYYNQPFVSVVADYFSVLLLSSWKVNKDCYYNWGE